MIKFEMTREKRTEVLKHLGFGLGSSFKVYELLFLQNTSGVLIIATDKVETYASYFHEYDSKIDRGRGVCEYNTFAEGNWCDTDFELISEPHSIKEAESFEHPKNKLLFSAKTRFYPELINNIATLMRSKVYNCHDIPKPFSKYIYIDYNTNQLIVTNGRMIKTYMHLCNVSENVDRCKGVYLHQDWLDVLNEFKGSDIEIRLYEKFSGDIQFNAGFYVHIIVGDYLFARYETISEYPKWEQIFKREHTISRMSISSLLLRRMIEQLPKDPEVLYDRNHYKNTDGITFNFNTKTMHSESDIPDIRNKAYKLDAYIQGETNGEIITFSRDYIMAFLSTIDKNISIEFQNAKLPTFITAASEHHALMPYRMNGYYIKEGV